MTNGNLTISKSKIKGGVVASGGVITVDATNFSEARDLSRALACSRAP